MRKILIFAVVALAIPALAQAGGWATVKLSSTPRGVEAGAAWNVRLTVLQHGVTPLAGIQPTVRIHRGTVTRTFAARPTATTGVYRVSVRFPSAGTWSWSIWDGFSRRHTYKPVAILPSSS